MGANSICTFIFTTMTARTYSILRYHLQLCRRHKTGARNSRTAKISVIIVYPKIAGTGPLYKKRPFWTMTAVGSEQQRIARRLKSRQRHSSTYVHIISRDLLCNAISDPSNEGGFSMLDESRNDLRTLHSQRSEHRTIEHMHVTYADTIHGFVQTC